MFIGLLNVEDWTELERYIDLARNTALRVLTIGVPTFCDLRFVAPFLVAILKKVVSPVFEEVRFVLQAGAVQDRAFIGQLAWDQIVNVLARTTVKRVIFVQGQSDRDEVCVWQAGSDNSILPRFRERFDCLVCHVKD